MEVQMAGERRCHYISQPCRSPASHRRRIERRWLEVIEIFALGASDVVCLQAKLAGACSIPACSSISHARIILTV